MLELVGLSKRYGRTVALDDVSFAVGSGSISVLLGLLFFVLGYALYACAFALAGAIVSRQEDVQSTTSPLLIALIAGYLGSLAVAEEPDGGLAVAATLLPPFAPLVVPVRAARDALPLWELLASTALMLVAIAALLWLAARVYERSVLRMGAPMRLLEGVRLGLRSSPGS